MKGRPPSPQWACPRNAGTSPGTSPAAFRSRDVIPPGMLPSSDSSSRGTSWSTRPCDSGSNVPIMVRDIRPSHRRCLEGASGPRSCLGCFRRASPSRVRSGHPGELRPTPRLARHVASAIPLPWLRQGRRRTVAIRDQPTRCSIGLARAWRRRCPRVRTAPAPVLEWTTRSAALGCHPGLAYAR